MLSTVVLVTFVMMVLLLVLHSVFRCTVVQRACHVLVLRVVKHMTERSPIEMHIVQISTLEHGTRR